MFLVPYGYTKFNIGDVSERPSAFPYLNFDQF